MRGHVRISSYFKYSIGSSSFREETSRMSAITMKKQYSCSFKNYSYSKRLRPNTKPMKLNIDDQYNKRFEFKG